MGKIKIGRWMSANEFNKLTSGCELVSNNRFTNCRCDSFGFCFFPELDIIGGYTIYDSHRWLKGIIKDDAILVICEVEENLLTKSKGVYCNPQSEGCELVTEYCVSSYNMDDFTIVSYGYGRSGLLQPLDMYEYAS